MINKILMNQVNSFKTATELTTDKKVNLIYGLNGVGKSTLSSFLYDRTESKYRMCALEGLTNEEVLVYNRQFVQDNFYEPEMIRGIFTLSKENKQANEKLKEIEANLEVVSEKEKSAKEELEAVQKIIQKENDLIENKIWDIRKKYGNGVLDFCLEKLKGSKKSLLDYLLNFHESEDKTNRTIKDLENEVNGISGQNSRRYNEIILINQNSHVVEECHLFRKIIIGNENSILSKFISDQSNSDWVQQGLNYLPLAHVDNEIAKCPFCQQETITKSFLDELRAYFDEFFKKDVDELKLLKEEYCRQTLEEFGIEVYENQEMISLKDKLTIIINDIRRTHRENLRLIEQKIANPSVPVELKSTQNEIHEANSIIIELNRSIKLHNEKIDNLDRSLMEIKQVFWNINKSQYKEELAKYNSSIENLLKQKDRILTKISNLSTKSKNLKDDKVEVQKEAINIDESVRNINMFLKDLGIENFFIEKNSNDFYSLKRVEDSENSFESLSEGEKMIISFLYFCELCKGKRDIESSSRKRIIVIDDPISSLSHIYIFNIGQMIKREFFKNSLFEQVFVLTHSLYFFYELTDIKHDRRKEDQKLFRILKTGVESKIIEMSYEEIQNDYHSYWSIIKDGSNQPALIANCMRNVIEYFFGFVENLKYQDVFSKEELKSNKYQAFLRYMDRQSHSLGQNVFDLKEFDYESFLDAFKQVFILNGYEKHYNKMMN